MKIFLALGALAFFAGCTHSIHLVHASDQMPYAKAGKMVEATSEQFSFMGFNDDTDYVDQAYNKLQSQCKNGDLIGITTQYSTSHGFLSWHNKILMRGRCLKA